jgi:hypothetical protein
VATLKHRKLRIAWSATWGIVAAFLVALWVRSYSEHDQVWCGMPADSCFTAYSWQGRILGRFWPATPVNWDRRWNRVATPTEQERRQIEQQNIDWELPKALSLKKGRSFSTVTIAHSILVGVVAAFAFAPWILSLDWRFSVRTLLIAMTLVAVGLGLIVWTR